MNSFSQFGNLNADRVKKGNSYSIEIIRPSYTNFNITKKYPRTTNNMSSHKQPQSSQKPLLLLILMLLGAFALRIYRLNAQPLTGDEAFSIVNWTRASFDYLFDTLAVIDPQPPMALLSFYGWVKLVGESEFAARMLSVITSTITVAIAYATGHRIAKVPLALTAMFLCATNPFLLWHAQDLRTYSLWIVTSTLSTYLLLSTTESRTKTNIKWIAYTAITILSIYTFYLQAFVIVAHNIYLAFQTTQHHSTAKPWLLSQFTIAATLAPWLLRPEIRNNNYQPTAGKPQIANALQSLTFGDTLPPLLQQQQLTPTTLTVSLILLSLITIWIAKPHKTALFIIAHIAIPITLLTLMTLITQKGYFRPRYLAATSFSIILAIALLLQSIATTKRLPPPLRIGLPLILIVSITSLNTLSIWHYHYDPAFTKSPNWRQITHALSIQTAPSDILVFNYPDPALTYYFKGPAAYTVLPTSPHPSQQAASEAILDLINQHDHIWFIPVYEKTWDGQQAIHHALNQHTQLISKQHIGNTLLYQYAPWHVETQHLMNHTNIQFGDIAILKGYRLTPSQPSLTPGSTINLEIFWNPQRKHTSDLTVFSHLLGPNKPDGSPLWAQDDYPPQDGHTTTSSWTPQILIRDTYTLTIPNTAPPGNYTITIGLYNPETGERFPLPPNIPQAEPNGATILKFTIHE